MIRIFIGYDPRETCAYHVLAHSIQSRTHTSIQITPLDNRHLTDILWTQQQGSNAFTFSRFLVPYLCGYEGQAIFMDCDMLCLADVAQLLSLCQDKKALYAVKHDYTSKTSTKYLNNRQQNFDKKNWASLMVFNCDQCRQLTPELINNADKYFLHQFRWLYDGQEIGAIPKEWNHLVGEYEPNHNAKIAHFTLGGPYFKDYAHCEYADAWRLEFDDMVNCQENYI